MTIAGFFHRPTLEERFPSKPSTPSNESVEKREARSTSSSRPRTASEQKRSKILPSIPLSSISTSSSLGQDPSPSPRGPRPATISRSPSRRRQFTPTSPPPLSAYHTRRLSSFFPQQPAATGTTTFISVISRPAILSSILAFLLWTDFYAVCQASSPLRNVLRDRELRDVVLTKFVVGYGFALRNSDPRLRDEMGDIPITLHDINVLLASLSTPLHLYPSHALSMQSALYPSEEQQRRAAKFADLTQAHSRFVLALQSLAHCSSQPAPVELEPESEQASAFIDDRSPARSLSAQSRYTNVSLASNRAHAHVRELSFPAPLSQPAAVARASMEEPSARDSTWRQFSLKGSSNTRQVKSAASSPTKAKRRSSIFSINQAKQPPPPPSEPRDLRLYSSGWRQSLKNASSTYRHTRGATAPSSIMEHERGWQSELSASTDDFGTLAEPPKTLFSEPGHRGHKSQSSFGSTSGSLSWGSSTDPSSIDGSPAPSFVKSKLSQSPATPLPTPPAYLQSTAAVATTSPHDLMLATSRVRAPVLRVFVPCTELSEVSVGGGTGSIVKCEEQLIESGCWSHMSVGDVVCNLGYVPPSGGPEEEEEWTLLNRRGRKQVNRKPTRTWLVFDGTILVPFCPTLDPAPGPDPLLLPSPWYYEHILPVAIPPSLSNLKMNINRIPPAPPTHTTIEPQMVLVNLPITVKSPHSNGGWATVRKWAWTARVHRGIGTPDSEIGVGWHGEWILEGEGTIEGKQELVDMLHGDGHGKREWEFVRHRSGRGKIWLKLLDSSLPELRSQSHPPPPVLSTIDSMDSIPRT